MLTGTRIISPSTTAKCPPLARAAIKINAAQSGDGTLTLTRFDRIATLAVSIWEPISCIQAVRIQISLRRKNHGTNGAL
jgi:hypothetical protein